MKNRVYRSITAVTSLAVLGGVALSPLSAFADTSAGASVEVNTKHSLFGLFDREHKTDVRASTTASTSIRVRAEEKARQKIDDRMEKVGEHTNAAFMARITLLENLQARIERMKRLGDDEKASLSAEIDAQIKALNDYKASASTTSSTTLKNLRDDFRVYALVAPRAAIMAAADRVISVANAMETVGDKVSVRISEAKSAGKDVTAAESSYADYKVKVAGAKVEATAALTLVQNLKADNGDKDAFTANKQTLTEARAKIKAAMDDLKAARKDLAAILKVTKGIGVHASSTVEVR